jgi:hypothetical protein
MYNKGKIVWNPDASLADACFAYAGHLLNPELSKDSSISSAMAVFFTCNLSERQDWTHLTAGESGFSKLCEVGAQRNLAREVSTWLEIFLQLKRNLGLSLTDKLLFHAFTTVNGQQLQFENQLIGAGRALALSVGDVSKLQRVLSDNDKEPTSD